MMTTTNIPLTVVLSAIAIAASFADEADSPSRQELLAGMRRAAEFYVDEVASHGGYVYYYALDLVRRWGEGEATADQIWVQPPGTPTVGMAFLHAYKATGDASFLKAATRAGEALLYGQLESGGWTNAIDFNPDGERVARYRNGKGKGRNHSTLDDDITQSAIRFLARLDEAHRFEKKELHEAVALALAALLAAQFENGGFPQVWSGPVSGGPSGKAKYPDYDWRTENRIKEYWDQATLNDGAAITIAETLTEAYAIYNDERYRRALLDLGQFLIDAQMPALQPAWAQQYGPRMQPIWARAFEPPAITSRESQDVMKALLLIHRETGDPRFLEPIPKAIDYFRRSLLEDGRLARFYELESNRPLYMEREGRVYTLTYEDDDLPSHYGWKVGSQLDKIERQWKRQKSGDLETPASGSKRSPREILDSLDDKGRWISTVPAGRLTGQPPFQPGERYISSAVFSENLRALADAVAEMAK